MMGRNQRRPAGRRGSKLKARLGIATAVVVGGGAIGAVAMATTSHPSASKVQSASYNSSYSNWSNQGNVLNAGLSDYSWSHSRAMTMFSHLTDSNHLTQMWHGHSMLAFERGRVILATKNFVLVRSASGKLNVWWLSHGTKVTNVASSMTGTTAMTGSRAAATAAMAGQMAPATNMLTGSMMTPSTTGTMLTAQQMLAPTTQTVSVNIAGTGITISVTVTNNMAMVWQNGQTSGMWWKQPATMTAAGLQRGDLVFIAGTRSDWALHAKVILVEKAATTTTTPTVAPSMTMTPTATPSMTVAPTAPAMGATPTPSMTSSVAPGSGGTHS
jgi:hypothetical protein